MPAKRRGVLNARALRRLWAAALCLCLAAPAAQAMIGSGETPIFSYNAYECMVTGGTDAEDSLPFACNAYECVVTGGTDAEDSLPFAYSAYECVNKHTSGTAESPDFFASYVPVNGDCVVNVLDLIIVRNNLGKDWRTNWKTDVNGDGKTNILDLIAIRNMLGRKCSQ